MVEPEAAALGRRSWQANRERHALDANAGRRAMTYWDKIEEAENEARRFLDRVAALRERHADDEHMQIYFYAVGFKERAAMKRASMDLSRALVNLRRSY
jgi:hypothetical protein